MEVQLYKSGDIDKGDWTYDPPIGYKDICSEAMSVTFSTGDIIIAILSILPLDSSSAFGSVLLSKRAKGHGLKLIREARNGMNIICAGLQIPKVLAVVDNRRDDLIKWVKAIGFDRVGTTDNGIEDTYIYEVQ